jgi:hypothetical protein
MTNRVARVAPLRRAPARSVISRRPSRSPTPRRTAQYHPLRGVGYPLVRCLRRVAHSIDRRASRALARRRLSATAPRRGTHRQLSSLRLPTECRTRCIGIAHVRGERKGCQGCYEVTKAQRNVGSPERSWLLRFFSQTGPRNERTEQYGFDRFGNFFLAKAISALSEFRISLFDVLQGRGHVRHSCAIFCTQ